MATLAQSPITTIAEFKRRMVPGTKWSFVANWWPEPTIRTCTVNQSNRFALSSVRTPGESSWCDWPKSKQVTFIIDTIYPENCGVRIDHEGGFLIYRPIQEGGAA